MCSGHFAHIVIELLTGNVTPSASLQQRSNRHENDHISVQRRIHVGSLISHSERSRCLKSGFASVALDVFYWCVRVFFHLKRHLNAVLIEPYAVVWFPWSPVSEGCQKFVSPGVPPRYIDVIQTGPHITGGCAGPQNAIRCIFAHHTDFFSF